MALYALISHLAFPSLPGARAVATVEAVHGSRKETPIMSRVPWNVLRPLACAAWLLCMLPAPAGAQAQHGEVDATALA